MESILITGATGFIGSALVESLVNNNYEVWCTTRGEINFEKDSGNIKYINCDLNQLDETIGSYYAVINCAASLGNDSSWKSLSDNNCGALENLILNVDCTKFIHISSCSIFSEISNLHSQPDPPNIYGLSKYASEKILEFNSHRYDSSIIIRYPIVIGAKKKTRDFVKYIYETAVNNGKIELYGKGAFYRNVIHINEAVSAIISGLETNSELNFERMNVGSSNSETVLDICRFIVKETHSSSDIILSENEGDTDFDAFIDVSNTSRIGYNCLTIRENINNYLLEMINEI
jgi:nucleoside-diphosphate-sugar epimerase